MRASRLWRLGGAAALALLLVGCLADPDASVVAPPPQDGVDVLETIADLRLEPEALALGGRVSLVVAVPDTLGTLVLGLDDALTVRAVRVDGRPVEILRDGDALGVPVGGAGGVVVVDVDYDGTPAAGLYAGEAPGQRVVYTDAWPDRAAGWLPGVHHPSDPTMLDLTLDVPAAFDVAASGVAASDSVGGGRRVARFVLDRPAPVYTAAFAVGDFDVVEGGAAAGGAVPLRHVLLAGERGRAGRLGRTGAALDTLAALLGPYPYAAYATVQVPMRYAGMENAAAPFLRADLYGADAPGRNAVEEVNVHELVHQWWGNDVVPADWRDLWLSEGPATYLTAEVYRRLDGEDAGRRHLVRMVREIGLEDAARRLVPASLDDPADVLSATVYNKGGAVLHLLRLTLGDAAFWHGLRRVREAYADRPLSTAAFQRALERETGRDLSGVFRVWVYGEGLPALETRWDGATQTLSWTVTGDGGTLDGVPFELFVRQGGGAGRFVAATAGSIRLLGADAPTVEPVGILLRVE
ncbi:M1 family aminopeptidase [Rubrivirga litoralis]|uniref:Aminopeptidase N n=1 Tax=Rubrivirga litoralis TaxID=3075598 RepID=A0ABU3BS23_9BACT|nr:M1 family aminopeptidase [Rubrivirga sp. F394]MDT0632092.1 M1 family aminopeptidase [Rubrivirga sp. F394]